MRVVDLPQLLLLFFPRRNKGLFLSMIGNQQSLLMNKEMMPGLITKLIRLMRLNGKLTSPLLEPIILTLLKTHWFFQKLLFKERSKSTQLVIAHPTSPHTPKETMLGMMPSITNPTR
jgi:hypothetical protein